MQSGDEVNQRRKLAALTSFDISILNLKSPILAACWSFAFPGFGHFYVNSFLFGMVLMTWAFTINNLAKINLCIYYSLQGNFEAAKASADITWFIGYVLVYAFCMWDSYRRAVEGNKQFLLTYKNDKKVPVFQLSSSGINYITKKNPWLASLWGMLSPGLDHIYINKLPPAIFSIIWMTIVSYKSHWLAGIMYTCWGDFEMAKSIIDPQWFLFLPSIYGFVGYEGYSNTIAINKLFKYDQAIFLRENFQDEDFIMPV